jgi:uncharacterized membrane protein
MSWLGRVVDWLAEQAWLDSAADRVVTSLDPLLRRPDVERSLAALRGGGLGHSLHPVLTDVPIGFWTASLLLDLVCESKAAGLLSAVGSAGAVGAAASGFADWTQLQGRRRRIGMVHAGLNGGALGLELLSLGARLRRRRLRAFSYAALGWSVAFVSAWIGGELSYGSEAAGAVEPR